MGMTSCRLSHLLIEESTGQQMVFIREIDGERSFTISIGPLEAMAIQRTLRSEEFPRPLTHDLLQIVLDSFGIECRAVRVVDLRDDTFFAEMVLADEDDDEQIIDCRPSDALAIMVRNPGVALEVDEEILRALN